MRGSHKVILLTAIGLVSQASSVITGIILVRWLTQDQYGSFRQAFFLAETVAYVFTLALPASLFFFFPRVDPKVRKGILAQTLTLQLSLGLIASLLLWGGRFVIADLFNNESLAGLLNFFGFYPLAQVPSVLVAAVYLASDRYKIASAIQLAINLSKTAVLVVGGIIGLTVSQLLMTVLIYTAVMGLVIVVALRRDFSQIEMSWNRPLIGKQMRYAVPLGLSGTAWFLGKEVDKYCLALFVVPSMFAVYAVGALEIPVFNEISVAIATVLVPSIAMHHRDGNTLEIAATWREVVRKSVLVFLPSFALLLLVSKPMIAVLYTTEYLDAVPVFRIYLGLILIRILNPSPILQGIGETKVLLYSSLLLLVTNVALNFLFLGVLGVGIIGPAIATLIAFAAMNTVATLAATSKLGVTFRQIFPFGDSLKILTCTLAAFVIPFLLFSKIPSFFWQGAAMGTTFAVVFALLAHWLRIYTSDDLQVIFGRFRRQED